MPRGHQRHVAMQGSQLDTLPHAEIPIPPMPTAEAVVAMLLDMGSMAVSTGSMMAPEAVMATVSFITVSVEGTVYVVLSREENSMTGTNS